MNAEETKQKIAELETLRAQIRRWRSTTIIVILAIVIVCVWSVVASIRSLAREGPHQELFMKELMSGFNERVLPPAEDIAKQALNDLVPVVHEEIKHLNARAPDVATALQKEGRTLMDNLPQRAEKVLDATFTSLVRQRETKIKKMFPTLTDEQIGLLMHNLIEEGSVNMASVMDDMFKPHEETFQNILTHLYQIQEDEAGNIQDDKPTWEMAVLLFDMVREDMKDVESMEYAEALEEGTRKAMETVHETAQEVRR